MAFHSVRRRFRVLGAALPGFPDHIKRRGADLDQDNFQNRAGRGEWHTRFLLA
jgi:hypothetical protein